jgi:hypothetical protein
VAAEQVEGTNGTTSPVDLRSQILSSIPDDDAAEVQADTVEADTEVEESTEEAVEAAADEAEPVEDDETEDSDEEAVVDPKAAKGLDAVRKAEKRHREKMDADRAEFAAEKQKWSEKVAKVDEYESAAKRISHDPVALLNKLGVPKDAYELIAHAIFAESQTGEKDPARKQQAQARLIEREKEDKYTAMERRQAELEKKIEQQKIDAESAAHARSYIEQLNTAATTKHPLIAHMLKVDAEDASDGLAAAYDRLVKAGGKEPTPAQVVAEMDRKERARFKRLGIDPATVMKTGPVVAGKPAAKPVNGHAKPTNGNAPKTRDDILAELDAL